MEPLMNADSTCWVSGATAWPEGQAVAAARVGLSAQPVAPISRRHHRRASAFIGGCLLACLPSLALIAGDKPATGGEAKPGVIQCANLIYGDNKTSVCYSPKFLEEIEQQTTITTSHEFSPVRLDSSELYQYPFAVMTGEGAFTLTQMQRDNLRDYLNNGGFLVASAGCSSSPWSSSFRQEIKKVFPDAAMVKIDPDHPIFHSVYDIDHLAKNHSSGDAHLEGLEVDGRIVMVFSSDGLNDTANAGGKCCCCGGDEIRNARQVNVNLLGYALTH